MIVCAWSRTRSQDVGTAKREWQKVNKLQSETHRNGCYTYGKRSAVFFCCCCDDSTARGLINGQISLHFWQRLVSLSFGTHLDFEWFAKNESKNTDKPFSRVAESMKRDPKHVLYAARTNVLHKRKEQAETNGKERIEKPADNHTNQKAKCKSKSETKVNEERWAIRSNKSV